MTSPGYLDVLLHQGQRDLFREPYVEMSVYSILKCLGQDPRRGRNYERFWRDMDRHFALWIKTDRFRNPANGKRMYIARFRVLEAVVQVVPEWSPSRFYFNSFFLESLRSGYLRRLDWDFCLHLDRQQEPLARFLYAHLLKRLGDKSGYHRSQAGFLTDVGLGHVARMVPMRRNEFLKRTLYPVLDALKGKAFSHYHVDAHGQFFFVPVVV
jgi:hypothetical protein